MTASELLPTLKSTYGEFTEYNGSIEWYASIEGSPEEPADELWAIYCETAAEIRPLLPRRLGDNRYLV